MVIQYASKFTKNRPYVHPYLIERKNISRKNKINKIWQKDGQFQMDFGQI